VQKLGERSKRRRPIHALMLRPVVAPDCRSRAIRGRTDRFVAVQSIARTSSGARRLTSSLERTAGTTRWIVQSIAQLSSIAVVQLIAPEPPIYLRPAACPFEFERQLEEINQAGQRFYARHIVWEFFSEQATSWCGWAQRRSILGDPHPPVQPIAQEQYLRARAIDCTEGRCQARHWRPPASHAENAPRPPSLDSDIRQRILTKAIAFRKCGSTLRVSPNGGSRRAITMCNRLQRSALERPSVRACLS